MFFLLKKSHFSIKLKKKICPNLGYYTDRDNPKLIPPTFRRRYFFYLTLNVNSSNSQLIFLYPNTENLLSTQRQTPYH